MLTETNHSRLFRENKFVYPVLSRRSGGISIGINLNPDKVCNFDCIYCQVDRTRSAQERFVELPRLLAELQTIFEMLAPGGDLWQDPEFKDLPESKRHVADIAFSGDGEPTTFKNFYEVVCACVELKERLETLSGSAAAKMVIISNATGFDRPDVKRAFLYLDDHHGEIWAKLDAGTPEYFKFIDATDFPFEKVLANLADCARSRATVIQSCFMRVNGQGPSSDEIAAYVKRLQDIATQRGTIKRVQVYTVQRNPALPIVSSLSNTEVDMITQRVRDETCFPAESFYGSVPQK